MDRNDLENAARTAAASAGIPAEVFLGLVQTESAWNPRAQSGVGAVGLTQIMPKVWLNWLGMTIDQLWEPVQNLTAGARIFADELRRFGSVELAAMAYNAGSPAVTRAIQKAGGSMNPEDLDPYLPAETRAYWKKVLTWANHYAGQTDAISATVEAAAEDVTETVKDSPGIATLGLVALLAMAWWKR